jgi:hypothetical protein
MKSLFTFLSLCLLLGASPAHAQAISNGNFETWAPSFGVEAPTGWLTTDDVYAFYYLDPRGSYKFGAVSKSTDAHGGTYAAKLTSTAVQTTSGGSVVVPGELVLGAKTGVYFLDVFPLGGSAYTSRPTQMQLYYKFSGTVADSALALVYLTKTINGVPSIVGVGGQNLAPAATYTALNVPISYANNTTTVPDSIHVVLMSGYGESLFDATNGTAFPANIKAGSTLLVDDITFSGAPLAVRADASVQSQLTVGPNPSPAGRFVISSPAQPGLAAAPLTVLDVTGRTVVRQPAQAVPTGQRDLDLSALPLGIYTLRLDSKEGILTRQLVVK